MRVNESAGTNSLLKGDTHGTGSVYGDLLKEKNKLSIKTSSIDDWFTNTKVEKIDISNRDKRFDLTNLAIITIDGEDAKDFDDAVFVEKYKSDKWKAIVSIADVSHCAVSR